MKNSQKIRIAYAEPHLVCRKGIISLIEKNEDFEVAVDVDNGEDLIKQLQLEEVPPHICILAINMPKKNGFETIAELKRKWPEIKIVVLTVFEIKIYVARMIKMGANAYLLKSCKPEEIIKALYAVYEHGIYFSEFFSRNIVNSLQNPHTVLPRFTPKETQLLKLCCSDLSYCQIAKKIGTTLRSVDGLRDNLFRKLDVNSRVSLALFAVKMGLVTIDINHSSDPEFYNKKTRARCKQHTDSTRAF